ncbi:hypothetical protein B9Z55_005791 [Caenorhabditis nigoni]|uniref:Uncharacterized protein n=1 Tax=Caenorhabditis nigoni TaxID=1611254 RepID=A0A2G5V2D4_9PELO|nr:hypothetical protein B9Z55_005791 [Caenorhabditis nigoni]
MQTCLLRSSTSLLDVFATSSSRISNPTTSSVTSRVPSAAPSVSHVIPFEKVHPLQFLYLLLMIVLRRKEGFPFACHLTSSDAPPTFSSSASGRKGRSFSEMLRERTDLFIHSSGFRYHLDPSFSNFQNLFHISVGTHLVLAMNANVYSIVCLISFLVLCISAQLHADNNAAEVEGIVDKRSPYRLVGWGNNRKLEGGILLHLEFLEFLECDRMLEDNWASLEVFRQGSSFDWGSLFVPVDFRRTTVAYSCKCKIIRKAFAFAKRSDEDLDFLEKRARYGFAKRSPYRTFAFAKRASPYGFAFAKRGQFSSFA